MPKSDHVDAVPAAAIGPADLLTGLRIQLVLAETHMAAYAVLQTVVDDLTGRAGQASSPDFMWQAAYDGRDYTVSSRFDRLSADLRRKLVEELSNDHFDRLLTVAVQLQDRATKLVDALKRVEAEADAPAELDEREEPHDA